MNNEEGRRLEERRLHQRRRQAFLPGAEDTLKAVDPRRVKERSFTREFSRARANGNVSRTSSQFHHDIGATRSPLREDPRQPSNFGATREKSLQITAACLA